MPPRRTRTETQPAPHIVWFVCDQLRADALGFMGSPVARTPNLDRLAGQGVILDNMFCQVPVCMASRACMLTGRYPMANRMAGGSPLLDPRETTLAEQLLRNGYRTGHFGKLHLTPQQATWHKLGSDRPVHSPWRFWEETRLPHFEETEEKHNYGFQHVVGFEDILWGEYIDWLTQFDPRYADILRTHGRRSPEAADWPWRGTRFSDVGTRQIAAELHPSFFIASSAADYFRSRHAHGSVFMHVSFVDPHHPFDPPEEVARTYDIENIPLPKYEDTGQITWPATIADRLHRMAPGEAATREMKQTTIAYYYAMIEVIDRAVGKVVEAVRRAGELENTVFVFISDHGELLGNYGLWKKGSLHYDDMIRIPSFVAWEGHIEGGRRFDGLLEEIDVAPTLYELAGIEPHAGVQGRSFADVLRGERKTGRPWAFTQSCYAEQGGPYARCLTVRTKTAKINYYSDEDVLHLFDLAADPDERRDVSDQPEYRRLRDDMMRLLLQAMDEQRDPLPVQFCQW